MTLPPKDNKDHLLENLQATDPVACFKKLLKNPSDRRNLIIFSELFKPKFDQD